MVSEAHFTRGYLSLRAIIAWMRHGGLAGKVEPQVTLIEFSSSFFGKILASIFLPATAQCSSRLVAYV